MSFSLPIFPAIAPHVPPPVPGGPRLPGRALPGRTRPPGTARYHLRDAVQAAKRVGYRAVLYRVDGAGVALDGTLDGSMGSAWHYHFMDPLRPGWGVLVCVTRGNVAFVRGEACEGRPNPLGYWRVDSPEAVRSVLDAGRRLRPSLTLRLEASSGRPVWWVAGTGSERASSVNASTSDVLLDPASEEVS